MDDPDEEETTMPETSPWDEITVPARTSMSARLRRNGRALLWDAMPVGLLTHCEPRRPHSPVPEERGSR